MKGRLLRILSAVVVVPVIATSMIFANDVKAAPKTYNGTIESYTREAHKVANGGKFFEPAADGKYQAMIYFHGASDQVNGSDLGNLPERLMNDMNKWIDMGYCDPMVVITPAIINKAAWGIDDFQSFVKDGNLASLLEEIQSGKGLGKKVDTSKPVIIAGYSMGASAALYAGTLFRNGDPNGDGIVDSTPIYNVGAFSPSYCYYSDDGSGWLKKQADVIFSSKTDGHFLLTCGAGEGTYFNNNYDTDKRVIENNGKNIKDRFKFHKYNSDWGQHGWTFVFEVGTFEYLYYLKYNELPAEEIMTNAVWGKVTISGTTTVGNTLTASLDTYYNVGASYRGYQWYRENTSTGEFTAITGATSSTYTLTSSDAGCKVRCKIWDTREPKTPAGNGRWGYSYCTTATISSGQQQPQAIKGTVTLSADYYRYGYEVKATVSGSNATNLKYQWKRGDSNISGATSNKYTLTESDIGKQISCVVTDKDGKYTGSISSSKTANIGKAFGPNPPSGVSAVNCSSKGTKDGKITGVSDKMEYAVQTNGNPGTFISISGTTVTGLAAGTYYVRYKSTSTADAGGMAEVYIKDGAAQSIKGTVTLSADYYRYGYEVSATVSGSNATNLKYQWKRGDSNIDGATSSKYTLTESDIGKQISCVVTDKDGKYTGSISSSKTATIGKAFGAKAPSGLAGVNCSSKDAKDGKILNVSDKMEYTVLTNGKPGTYTSVSGSSITGLSAGTYYIRYKETSTTDAGANAEITINVKASNTTPTVTTTPSTTAPTVTSEPTVEPAAAEQTVTTAPTATTVTSTSSKDQISAFVDRLYLSVLGREADEEGANYWTSQLVSFKMSGAQVAENFVLSSEFLGSVENDTQFVTVLYKAFFDRDPDDAGFAYWTKALSDKAMTREEVERNFVYSQEWADTCAEYGILSGSTVKPSKSIDPTEATLAFVERMYTKAMNRESDPEGKAYWAGKLANYECTGETIGLEFFTSAEMKGYNLDNEEFVKRLYSTFLDREADSTGLSFWINELENGAERADVVKGFAKSAEFEQRCIDARILPCEGLF